MTTLVLVVVFAIVATVIYDLKFGANSARLDYNSASPESSSTPGEQVSPAHDSSHNSSRNFLTTQATSSPVSSPSASPVRIQTDFSKKTATELAPDAQTLRAEVQNDPEDVPRSTLFFAGRLGKKMEAALKSEDGAASLFQELQDCVTSQRLEGSVTSQTLCLQDAQELAQAYPQRLKDEYSALYQRAEPRVRSLLIPTGR